MTDGGAGVPDPVVSGPARPAVPVAVALVVALVVLSGLVAAGWAPLIDLDRAVVGSAHALVTGHRGWLPTVRLVTDAGSPASVDVLTVVVGAVLLAGRRTRTAIGLVAGRAVELAAETALKLLVDRPRPVLPDPLAHAAGTSFPSGHTAGTAVLCASLLLACTRRPTSRPVMIAAGGGAAVAVVAVAASRVLLGVHNPSDVLGGALLGVLSAVLVTPLLLARQPRDPGGDRRPAG